MIIEENKTTKPPESLKQLIANRKEVAFEIQQREEVLEALKRHAREMDTLHIPEAMMEAGIDNFETEDNVKVKIKNYVKASIPTTTAIAKERDEYRRELLIEKRRRCFEELEACGAGSLIKSQLHVDFEKGDTDKKAEALQKLESAGINAEVSDTVHAGQLTAWVKEQLQQGTNIDTDLFSVYEGNTAELRLGRIKL